MSDESAISTIEAEPAEVLDTDTVIVGSGIAGALAALRTDDLANARRPLARHTRLELTRLAGQDHGSAAQPWRTWLAAQPEPLPCQPWQFPRGVEVTA